jgi:hypothetical protein
LMSAAAERFYEFKQEELLKKYNLNWLLSVIFLQSCISAPSLTIFSLLFLLLNMIDSVFSWSLLWILINYTWL